MTTAESPPLDLYERKTLLAYVFSMLSYRFLVRQMANNQLTAETGDTMGGQLWHVLNPLLNAVIYFMIFGVVLGARDDNEYFVSFLIIGLFTFRYLAANMSTAAQTIAQGRGLMQAASFPRGVLAASGHAAETMRLGPAIAMTAAFALVIGPGVSARWLLAVPGYAVVVTFAFGLNLVTAWAASQVPDVRQLVFHATRILFYLSGVFFSAEQVPDGFWRLLFEFNPLQSALLIMRHAFLGTEAGLFAWCNVTVWAVATVVAGLELFRRTEGNFTYVQ